MSRQGRQLHTLSPRHDPGVRFGDGAEKGVRVSESLSKGRMRFVGGLVPRLVVQIVVRGPMQRVVPCDVIVDRDQEPARARRRVGAGVEIAGANGV
jgi:hypothetical protein